MIHQVVYLRHSVSVPSHLIIVDFFDQRLHSRGGSGQNVILLVKTVLNKHKCLSQKKNDPRSYARNVYNCVKKPEKNSGLQRGLNPWPRDTGATLYQLSYEATDIGSRSILGSYLPVKDMKVNDAYETNHMWTADMKSNEEWSSQLCSQFLQLRKVPLILYNLVLNIKISAILTFETKENRNK